jgi:hypothetical protein
MDDITDLMNHYRVVARMVWNTGFWTQAELRTWDARDQFEQVKKVLFKALVGARIKPGHLCDLDVLAEFNLRVIPVTSGPVPIMIQRPSQQGQATYWDDPFKQLSESQAKLQFIDYFDWDLMNYADFQYYRVRIKEFPQQSHLVGREALVEHSHARVFFDSPPSA